MATSDDSKAAYIYRKRWPTGSGKTTASVLASKVEARLNLTQGILEKVEVCEGFGRKKPIWGSPSIIKLVYDSVRMHGRSSEGKTSSEIWTEIEAQALIELHYDTGAVQFKAGTHVSGAFGFLPQVPPVEKEDSEKFSPLPFSILPLDSYVHSLSSSAKQLLNGSPNFECSYVTFDAMKRSVNLFMPGFDKSEIKLFQYRGGSVLLVEAGDQRRIIKLPNTMQGKVAAAKFADRNLVVKLW